MKTKDTAITRSRLGGFVLHRVGSVQMEISRIALIMLGISLTSCDGPAQDQSLPQQVQASLNAGQPDASYQISVKGGTKVYVVTYGTEFCGSGGCSQVVFIQEDRKLQKAFDGFAKKVDPNFEYPGELRLNFLFSGLACNKVDNATPCEHEMLWTGGKLIELK